MRLIDADDFERRCMFDRDINDMQDVIYTLRDFPTIDAEPVKHGHWIEKNDRITCSNCGREVMYNSDYLPQTTHFCYNCGAKMSNGKDFDFNNSLLRSWE